MLMRTSNWLAKSIQARATVTFTFVFMSTSLGDTGVYVGALASGLADVDAITLSMAELSRGDGSVADSTAANAIVLAAASNAIVKGALVWSISSRSMRRLVVPAVLGAVVSSVALTFLV